MFTARSSLDSVAMGHISDEFLLKDRKALTRSAWVARIPQIAAFLLGVLAGVLPVAPLVLIKHGDAATVFLSQLNGELNGLVPNCELRNLLESWAIFSMDFSNGLVFPS